MENLSQNQEYCILKHRKNNRTLRIKLHDYDKIYSIPGLYEHIFLERLKYCSLEKVCGLFKKEVERDLVKPKKICVLDLGAGNGIAGEDLLKMRFSNVYRIDIEPEAVKAVKRDRPFVYKAYFVVDLMQLSDDLQTEFETTQTFNGMVSVGSLGFDNIPPKVFGRAFNMLTIPGWVAFNIKEDFYI